MLKKSQHSAKSSVPQLSLLRAARNLRPQRLYQRSIHSSGKPSESEGSPAAAPSPEASSYSLGGGIQSFRRRPTYAAQLNRERWNLSTPNGPNLGNTVEPGGGNAQSPGQSDKGTRDAAGPNSQVGYTRGPTPTGQYGTNSNPQTRFGAASPVARRPIFSRPGENQPGPNPRWRPLQAATPDDQFGSRPKWGLPKAATPDPARSGESQFGPKSSWGLPQAATPESQFGSKRKWGPPKAVTPEGSQQGTLGTRLSQSDPSTQGPPGIGAEGGEARHDQSQSSGPVSPELVDRGMGAETGRQQGPPPGISQGIGTSPSRPSYETETGQPQGVETSPNVVNPSYETRTERQQGIPTSTPQDTAASPPSPPYETKTEQQQGILTGTPQDTAATPPSPSYETGAERQQSISTSTQQGAPASPLSPPYEHEAGRQKELPTSASQEIGATPSPPPHMAKPGQKEPATTLSRGSSTAPKMTRYEVDAGHRGQFTPHLDQGDRGQYRPPFSARGERRQDTSGFSQARSDREQPGAPYSRRVLSEERQEDKNHPSRRWEPPVFPQMRSTRTETEASYQHGVAREEQEDKIETRNTAASPLSPPHEHEAGQRQGISPSTSKGTATSPLSPPYDHEAGRQKDLPTSTSQEIGATPSPPSHMAEPGQKEPATTFSQGPSIAPKIGRYEFDAGHRGQSTSYLDQGDRSQYRPPFPARGERQQDTSGFSQARGDREQPGAPYSRRVLGEERQEDKNHPSRRWEPPVFPQIRSTRTETDASYQHGIAREEQEDKIEARKQSKGKWPETLGEARGLQGGDQYLSDLKKYNRTRTEAYTMGQEQSHVDPKPIARESQELGPDNSSEEPLQPFRDMSEKRIRRPKTLSPEEIEFEKRQLLRAREKLRTRPGFDASESAILEEEGVLSGKAAKKAKKAKKREKKAKKAEGAMIPLYLPEYISVANLATALKTRLDDFTAQLKIMGFTDFSHDHVMNAEIAGLIAMEYGYEPIADTSKEEDLLPRHIQLTPRSPPAADKSLLPLRPPVVTIMGHVDHGKTTILDWLRKSSIVDTEHGGITQHIGAFSVTMPSGKIITFLDTPGHSAFLSMRERGANVTDIVILVVAADDSVMPQTIEAIKHAKAANVPMIVAINKIDKEGSDVKRVKQDLGRVGVDVEDFGGDTQVVLVSGKKGQGMDELEEATVTLSEVLDLRAEDDGPCEGWVLEAGTQKRGKVATVLVRRGTLRPGNVIVAGGTWAKVRNLANEHGVEVASAPPGTPVIVDGWKDQPLAGDFVIQAACEDKAKKVVGFRIEKAERLRQAADMEAINAQRRAQREKDEAEKEIREKAIANGTDPVAAVAAYEKQLAEGKSKYELVNFVVKGDVAGSVEAVVESISPLGNEEVGCKVIRSSFGTVSEFDIDHAAAAGGYVICFNLPVEPEIIQYARNKCVTIMSHNVIYRLVDEVISKLSERLAPSITYSVIAEAEILKIFEINIKGRIMAPIAGCKVRNGDLSKNAKVRIVRGGVTIYDDGAFESMKNFGEPVTEVKKGFECGLGFKGCTTFEVGDIVQTYNVIKEARTLARPAPRVEAQYAAAY